VSLLFIGPTYRVKWTKFSSYGYGLHGKDGGEVVGGGGNKDESEVQ